jgi:hypothetical protein
MSWLREPNAEPIPGYRLIEPLGSGGFGEVWKCEAPGGLFKAIKFVYGNLNSLDVDGVRAEQELHALQRVKEVRHPFICSLDRIETVNGELVIVMELADRTLHDLYAECQASGLIGIPRDNLLRYLRDAAEALDFMNEKYNLQHLDIKPRNLFLIGDRVQVADFGLVKHLERQSASGLLGGVTPLYASPETFNGKITQNSDQYSLAIVYQELLTGQRPFTGKNVRALAQQHLYEEPDLRALPEADRPIVSRALSKDPEKRFPNCMGFIAGLYKARRAARPEPVAELVPAGIRPKSLSETMEDIGLEGIDDGDAVSIDAAPPPAKREAKGKLARLAANGLISDGDGDGDMEVSQMGVTIPQPETGALRPTLILGIGSFGRKALMELRCRFLDRFGDLNKLPLLRFLCVDPDPEAVNLAIRGAPEVALTRNEVYHLPLQPVSNYRRRSIEQLSEWLPREKLYAIPRSLQPQGNRALGRLAFADNQQRLLARLKREIQEVTNPDVLYQSVNQTGLALRDNTPRVYVIAAAGGGSSGLLPDLGYGLKRLLAQLRHPDARVNCLLFCGAPGDPATPKSEQANVYATLTELNHFSDPGISFAAQYGADGKRIIENGTPFNSIYLLPLANRSPDSMDELVAHLGSYLFHELTTPLGLRLDYLRRDGQQDANEDESTMGAPVRSFGTYAVWFPRGLLMRLASRQACRRLIDAWMTGSEADLSREAAAAVHALCEQVAADPVMKPEALFQQIEGACYSAAASDMGSTPSEALTAFLSNLEEQSLQGVAQDDPGTWARQAVNRVRDWVGSAEGDAGINEWRKTKLNKTLALAAQKTAQEWDKKLSAQAFGLMEHPGARVATAEAALHRLQKFCQNAAQGMRDRFDDQAARSQQAWTQMEKALEECVAGGNGFRLFSRSRSRQLRSFMESLAHYARQRLAEENVWAVYHFYLNLSGKLADRVRDLGFCRQRLRHLQENIELGACDPTDETMTRAGDRTPSGSPLPSTQAFWEAIRHSSTARVVLPDGEEDLERAALRFLQKLQPEHWSQLDKELHERVLAPRGGLHGACTTSGDLTRMLANPLLDEASQVLSEHLPIMDVAQILNSEFGLDSDKPATNQPAKDLDKQARTYLERAIPLISTKKGDQEHTFLLVPASNAGRALGDAVRNVLPEVKVVRVPGQSDLMICREQSDLGPADLQSILTPCRAAYDGVVAGPTTSPHARFDILDWIPMDP